MEKEVRCPTCNKVTPPQGDEKHGQIVTFPAEGKERLLEAIKCLEPVNWRVGGTKLGETAVESVGNEPETLWWAGV